MIRKIIAKLNEPATKGTYLFMFLLLMVGILAELFVISLFNPP